MQATTTCSVPPDDVGAVPADGTAYPVTLGATFTPGAQESYHLLQYASFKPTSLSEEEPGALQYARGGSVRPVLAEFRNRTKAGETVRVQGNYVDLKETECVLVFDGSSFRLERLAGSGRRMNVVRPSRAASATTTTAAAATPQKLGGDAATALQVASTSPTASSSSSSSSASSTPPAQQSQSTVSHKRPRGTSGVPPTPGLTAHDVTLVGKRPRMGATAASATSAAATEDEDYDDSGGESRGGHSLPVAAEKNDEDPEVVMDFEELDEDKSSGGDDDLLSLASELEMGLQEGEPATAGELDDAAGSLFSDDEDEKDHADKSPSNPPATNAASPLSASTTVAGKSLPSTSNDHFSDSESDSDSDSDSGSDSDSESGSSESESESESE